MGVGASKRRNFVPVSIFLLEKIPVSVFNDLVRSGNTRSTELSRDGDEGSLSK
jgi:hypothetical protein